MHFKTILAFLAGLMLFAFPLQAKNDKHGNLPPGLQKKAQRGQPLPPGWQKKLKRGERLDRRVYEQEAVIIAPRDRDGLVTVRLDGKLVRVMDKTMEIVDILNR
jgi:hypothetical protein